MSRLGVTIGIGDLSVAELSAALLDGDLVRVDECFAATDLPQTNVQRAVALRRLVPPRLIAERMSAAWIYGLLAEAPARHDLCVEASKRVYTPPSPRITVREVVINDNDLHRIAGLAITTPLRTVIDISRSTPHFTQTERTVIAGLMVLGGVTLAHCEATLNATPHLPHKRRALERIRDVVTN